MRIKQALIEEVMSNFDFATVKRVMDFLNLTWPSMNGEEVPDEQRMRNCVRDLIKTLQEDEKYNSAAMEEFVVVYDGDSLSIQFILEKFSSNDAYFPDEEA